MIDDVSLLVNPASGRGRTSSTALRALAHLRARGIAVAVLVGSDAAESAALARRAVARGTGALVACGGDGLVNIALQAVAGTGTPLGVIPAGTGNDHARMLGIPLHDPVSAARAVAEGPVRTIDLGRADGRWFGTAFAGGFDAAVSARANRVPRPRGKPRYHLALLAELATLRPREYVLDLDGERMQVPAMLVAVGNGTSYGGGMKICPRAALDDGLLDVTVIAPASRSRVVRLMPTIYPGAHLRYPEVMTYRARSVRLSTPDLVGYADGEPFGALPLTCECVPRAAQVLVPRT